MTKNLTLMWSVTVPNLKWKYILHILAAASLIIAFVHACHLRFALPIEPMMWPDSFLYLSPGITLESTGSWISSARKFLYPLFLYLATAWGGSTSTLVVLQHLAGLAGGIVLAAALVMSLMPIWNNRLIHGLCCTFSVFVVHTYWSSPTLLIYECYVMPEVLFLTLSTLEFAALAWIAITLSSPLAKNQTYSLRWPLIALFSVNTGLYFAVPRWGLSAVIVPATVIVAAKALGFGWRNILVSSAAGTCIATLLFLLPNYFVSKKSDRSAAYFVELHLFGMHAHLVRAELARELALASPRFDRALLKDCFDAIDHELARSRNNPTENAPYPSLGFSPEQIIYGDSAASRVILHFEGDPNSIRRFFVYFYLSIWRHQPIAMLQKIRAELAYYYSTPSRGLSSASLYYDSLPLIKASADIASQGGYKSALEHSKAWSGYAVRANGIISGSVMRHDRIGITIEQCFGILLLPTSAFSFCGSIFILFFRRRRVFERLEFSLLLLSGFLTVAVFGTNLTIAILHSLYPGRYLDTNFTLSLMAAASSLIAGGMIGATAISQALKVKTSVPQCI